MLYICSQSGKHIFSASSCFVFGFGFGFVFVWFFWWFVFSFLNDVYTAVLVGWEVTPFCNATYKKNTTM